MPDRYWRTDQALHAAGPGLRILEPQNIDIANEFGQLIQTIHAPVNFQTYTRDCLNWLYQTACGRRVLNALVGSTCTIAFSQGNSAGVGNAQASMNTTAYEIAHNGAPGVNARAALTRCFTAYGARRRALTFRRGMDLADEAAWLAHVINKQPYWLIDRTPGSDGGIMSYVQSWRDTASRWLPSMWSSDATEGYFDDQLWLRRFGTSSAGLNLTPTTVAAWMTGTMPGTLSTGDRNQLKLATIVALEPFSRSGVGSSSGIRFAVGAHDAFRGERAPAIALGHELIHAYFSFRGEQPGEEFSHFSTVLFEYKCVGLGPWNNNATSENAIREQWQAVINAPPCVLDQYNQRVPGKRIRY